MRIGGAKTPAVCEPFLCVGRPCATDSSALAHVLLIRSTEATRPFARIKGQLALVVPLVSVLVPAYNCAAYLPRALRSVLAQNDPHLEIIVVDDGSTDGTAASVSGWPGVRIERQQNKGVSAARNRALALARGDWVAFLDADDTWHPTRLELGRRLIAARPSVGLVFSSFRLVDTDDRCLAADALWSYYRVIERYGLTAATLLDRSDELQIEGCARPAHVGDAFPTLYRGNVVKTSTVLIRRDLAQEGFDATLATEEDYDLWLRVAQRADMALIDEPLADVRRRPEQLTAAGNALVVAANAVTVVERHAAAAAARMSKPAVQSRLADTYRALAHTALVAGQPRRARAALRASASHGGVDARLVAYLLWSLVPGPITLGLGGVRRVVRNWLKAGTQ